MCKVYYKVVYINNRNKLTSRTDLGKFSITYIPNVWIKAKEESLENGYGIFIYTKKPEFRTKCEEIWECEVKNILPMKKIINVMDLSRLGYSDRSRKVSLPLPSTIAMAEEIKLIRKIR
jgi:hypothetical protein